MAEYLEGTEFADWFPFSGETDAETSPYGTAGFA
jgi:hypothetical protein